MLRFGCYPIISILGKHDGTVEGVRYFKCEDKHGLFARQNKITKANLPSFGSPLHQRWSYSHEGVTGMPKVSSYVIVISQAGVGYHCYYTRPRAQ